MAIPQNSSNSSRGLLRGCFLFVYQGSIVLNGALALWQLQNGSGAFAAMQAAEALMLLVLLPRFQRSFPETGTPLPLVGVTTLLSMVSFLMALLAVLTAVWTLRQTPAPNTIHLERPASIPQPAVK